MRKSVIIAFMAMMFTFGIAIADTTNQAGQAIALYPATTAITADQRGLRLPDKTPIFAATDYNYIDAKTPTITAQTGNLPEKQEVAGGNFITAYLIQNSTHNNTAADTYGLSTG